MSPETFTLSPCTGTVADIEGMIEVYEAAFATDYFSSFTFPRTIDPIKKRQWLRDRFHVTLSKPELRSFKITESSTGKIAAWARWGFPYQEDGKEMDNISSWPEGANSEVCEEKFGALHKKREGYVVKDDMYVVYLLCTDPAFRRKGLASRLLKHGLDLADAEGRKTYIEATKDGHPVYLKLGFKDIDIVTMDLSKWGGKELGVNRIMMRDPHPLP